MDVSMYNLIYGGMYVVCIGRWMNKDSGFYTGMADES